MSRGALYGLEIGNDLVIIAAAGEEAGQGRLLINLMIMVIIAALPTAVVRIRGTFSAWPGSRSLTESRSDRLPLSGTTFEILQQFITKRDSSMEGVSSFFLILK